MDAFIKNGSSVVVYFDEWGDEAKEIIAKGINEVRVQVEM